MAAPIFRTCVTFLVLAMPLVAHAAAIAQAITPLNMSVAGNESAVFSARFLDAQGRPAAGETVTFANDACGWFPNGGFSYATTTDANGVASARFTAFPQGITCWLVASAGAQAQFNVLTYLPAYAYLSAQVPASIVPGRAFDVDASAMYGAYRLYNADIAARIVAGTGAAAISPASANTGQDGHVRFHVEPRAPGDFTLELQFRDHVEQFSVKAAERPWQDLWWAGSAENGWGMSVVQHRDLLFSVIYAYDDAGKPTWYVVSAGSWNAAHTIFSGSLYRPHGSPFAAYDVARFDVGAPVGQASLDFTDPAHIALSYTIDGVSGRKAITRQPFGPVDLSGGIDVGDMWWGGLAQNGWGLAVLQQYRSLFAVWFTYDEAGAPVWYVMPSGHWSDAQTWEGRIYRTTGSPWLGHAYDPSQFRSVDAGSFRLRFAGDTGTFDYTIDGKSGSMPLQRQPF
jgi:hypothetical protein